MSWELRHIEKAEAEAALRAAAFTEEESGRSLVHSFAGGGGILLGADNDLDSALARLEEADEVAWTTHLLKHDLAVRVGNSVYFYNAARPERSEGS